MTSRTKSEPTWNDDKAKLVDFDRVGLLGLLVQPPRAAALLLMGESELTQPDAWE